MRLTRVTNSRAARYYTMLDIMTGVRNLNQAAHVIALTEGPIQPMYEKYFQYTHDLRLKTH